MLKTNLTVTGKFINYIQVLHYTIKYQSDL